MKRGRSSPKRKSDLKQKPRLTQKSGAQAKIQSIAAPRRRHAVKARNGPFPVVGIGASAGGLEAFTDLLKHLPPDTGMAFVLVQHLAPKHGSVLTELLSKASRIPVEEVRDGMTVKPDHVYVIPPNTNMAILRGVLHLMPRAETPGQHMPIDVFLRSLAEERKNRAIGVILSGTASDGTQGTKAIKAEGGITFAQDEKSAKYYDMPRNAIATGCVDFILSPKNIAKELARIGKHPYLIEVETEKQEESHLEPGSAFHNILSILRKASGVDFFSYRDTTLRRRIRRRLILLKMNKLTDYVSYLQQHPSEVDALYHDVLISVTSFFRDLELFQAVKQKLLPALLKNRGAEAGLRLWVPGCSTGEEAYSLAICIVEYLGEKGSGVPVQVFATDLSEGAIEKARAGVYRNNVEVEVSPERLRRFFVKTEGGYQISKPIREMCVFARHDMTKDPPFSRLDVISCRNLLIYLQPFFQKRIIPLFHYALKPQGYLILGTAETVGSHSDLFSLVDRKHRIYARKAGAVQPVISFDKPHLAPEKPEAREKQARKSWDNYDVHREAERILLSRYVPAGVLVNDEMQILQFRGRTGPYLEPAPGEATLNLLKMARQGLAFELRTLIQRAKKNEGPVRQHTRIKSEGEHRDVLLEVTTLRGSSPTERYFLVLFLEPSAWPPEPEKAEKKTAKSNLAPRDREINRLTGELESTKKYLQSVVEEQEATNEELRSANEEVLSSNEELQSTNEEMETAREELQSTNEELTTLNEELQNRIMELSVANNDVLNLLKNTNIPIVMLDRDLRIRRVTPPAEQLFNIIPTDIGRPISDLQIGIKVPDLREMIAEAIDRVSTKEKEVQDRQGRWYSMRIRPYKTAENKIEGAVMSLVDIHALKFTLNQQAQILDAANEAVYITDLTDRITYWNHGAERSYGWTRTEALGKNPHALLHTVFPLPFPQIQEELFRQGFWQGELVQSRKDGVQLTMMSNLNVERDDAGNPLAILQINYDITDQKKAQEVVQASSRRYKLLFERNLAGIFQVSLEGRILECNESFVRVFDFASREEALSLEVWDLCSDRHDWQTLLDRLGAQGTVLNHEMDMRRRDGARVSVIMNATLLEEQAGEPRMIEGILLDATEHKQREDYVRELSGRLFEVQDQERERIARELHDTTAASLGALSISLAETERSAAGLDPATREALAQSASLAKQCSREIRTVAYLLHPPLMHDFGLAHALRWYVEGFGERSGIKVTVDIPPAIDGLSRQVETAIFRIVQESLSNVRRHSGSKTAALRIAREDKKLTLELKDQGRGMPRGIREGSTGKSLGLGLIGMQERVKALNGQLEVKSRGQGTAIRAVLPLG
jgi:two-component system, chemotaxis family, CheB/CheR fusion protein